MAICAEDRCYAVEQALLRKILKSAARCETEGLSFLLLAVDTMKGWHPYALATITCEGGTWQGMWGAGLRRLCANCVSG